MIGTPERNNSNGGQRAAREGRATLRPVSARGVRTERSHNYTHDLEDKPLGVIALYLLFVSFSGREGGGRTHLLLALVI